MSTHYSDDDSDNDLFTEEIDIVFNRMENDKEHYIHEEFTQIILHPWYLNVHEGTILCIIHIQDLPVVWKQPVIQDIVRYIK